MPEARRIRPADAHRKVQAGQALLICAYEDETMCQSARLEGALTLKELDPRLTGMDKAQEMIFYCM